MKYQQSESERLWPDPFDAPEVPSRQFLETWLKTDEQNRDSDISEQIRESEACRRAIQLIRDEELLGISHRDEALAAMARAGLAPAAGAPSKPLPPMPTNYFKGDSFAMGWEVGQIVRCNSVVHIPRDGMIRKRILREPPLVILMERKRLLTGESCWGGFLCSSANWWSDFLADDDVVISVIKGRDYVAHLWVEITLSETQLGAWIATAAKASLQAIHELIGSLPTRPESSKQHSSRQVTGLPARGELKLERERLQNSKQSLADGFRGEAKACLGHCAYPNNSATIAAVPRL